MAAVSPASHRRRRCRRLLLPELRRWRLRQSGGTGTTEQFIALAEDIAGQDLDQVWDPWLFTGTKPEACGAAAQQSVRSADDGANWSDVVGERLTRLGRY